MAHFDDPEAVARYAEGPPRQVPGFADLHRMALVLLAEHAGRQAEILVLGAGGGLELRAFAQAEAGWRFTGIDPSAEMLGLATRTLGPLAERASLHHGLVHDAPPGPYDGATCLLTLHFLDRAERLATLLALRQRLRPGARLVVAHHSIPGDRAEQARWLARYAGFATRDGVDADMARRSAAGLAERLPFLTPDEDAEMLREAGFRDVEQVYAAFTFRGWVATAP